MKRLAFDFLLVALLALGFAPRGAHAAESYDACTNVIAALPAVINTQGTWCLDQDFITSIGSGSAISVNTNNVTIDCNGFRLDNRAAGNTTTAIGIASTDKLNTTIRRCDIRGFHMGVRLYGPTGGHLVEDNRFQYNTYIGANVHGTGSVVRRNHVLDTGGTNTADFSLGIYTYNSVDVIENLVSSVVARAGSNGNAYGIHTEANPTGSISSNRIRGLVRQGTGYAWGIFNSNSGRVILENNDLVSLSPTNAYGVRCHNAQGSSIGNIINGFAAGIINCSPDGGNLVAP